MFQVQQFSSSIGTQICPASGCGPVGGTSVNHGKIHCVIRQYQESSSPLRRPKIVMPEAVSWTVNCTFESALMYFLHAAFMCNTSRSSSYRCTNDTWVVSMPPSIACR